MSPQDPSSAGVAKAGRGDRGSNSASSHSLASEGSPDGPNNDRADGGANAKIKIDEGIRPKPIVPSTASPNVIEFKSKLQLEVKLQGVIGTFS